MKTKTLALMLSLALLASLHAPAQAAAQVPETFDAEAWFQGCYGGPEGLTKAQYMAREGMYTDAVFRADMYRDWAEGDRFRASPADPLVTVDGVPVRFPPGQAPRMEGERLLVSLSAMEEALGRQAPPELAGRAEVPLVELAGALGCGVSWNQSLRTAEVTTPDDYEKVDGDPPLWQRVIPGLEDVVYSSREDYMEAHHLETEREYYARAAEQMAIDADTAAFEADRAAWYAQFTADHADEIANFDADAYFVDGYPCRDCYESKEEYLAQWNMSEEQFEAQMKNRWIQEQYDPILKFPHYRDHYFSQHPDLAASFDPLAWYQNQDRSQGYVTSSYVPTAWPPAEMTAEDEDFYYGMLYYEIRRREQIETARRDWERLLKEEPDVAETFLLDMEHPYYAIDKSNFMYDVYTDYWTPEVYLRTHPGQTLEQAYWEVYHHGWSSGRYIAMDDYWAFRAAHPGWCAEVAVTVDGQPLYIPYGYTALSVDQTAYADTDALSYALGGPVEGDETGYAPIRAAAEALGCTVVWDQAGQTILITTSSVKD